MLSPYQYKCKLMDSNENNILVPTYASIWLIGVATCTKKRSMFISLCIWRVKCQYTSIFSPFWFKEKSFCISTDLTGMNVNYLHMFGRNKRQTCLWIGWYTFSVGKVILKLLIKEKKAWLILLTSCFDWCLKLTSDYTTARVLL